MWARILKNAFAPVFLAPFDYIAGNPPWINWENLPEGYRQETKQLWFDHGLFVHSGMDTILGKGKKDISMLMTYVAADSYLKDGGRFGFVITQSVFKTSGAGQGFRRFVTRRKRPLAVIFVDDFSEMQLFEGATNRTAVFIMRKGQPTKYPVQYAYWRKLEGGRKGGFDYDATLQEVTSKTKRMAFIADPVNSGDATSSWLTGSPLAIKAVKKLLGRSDYDAHEGVNSGGANAVYWFEILHDSGSGTVKARNITEGAKRKIESVQVPLEKDLLYPLLRGRDIGRWRAEPSASLLFVQDPEKRRGIDESVMEKQYRKAYEWLVQNRQTLLKRSSQSVRSLMKQHAFYSIFGVGPYTVKRWKVGWPEVGNELEAAVITPRGGKPTLSDHTIVEVVADNEDEAYFIAGVVNSTPFRFGVASYIVLHPDPHILENFRVPKFRGSALHKGISRESQRLSGGTPDAQSLINPKLDSLCAQLWGIDEKGLKAIQNAYVELHGPKQAAEEHATEAEE
jgi:methylase of polypeptide subunit release factors